MERVCDKKFFQGQHISRDPDFSAALKPTYIFTTYIAKDTLEHLAFTTRACAYLVSSTTQITLPTISKRKRLCIFSATMTTTAHFIIYSSFIS